MLATKYLRCYVFYLMGILTSIILSLFSIFQSNEEEKIEAVMENGLVETISTIPEDKEVTYFNEINNLKRSVSDINFSSKRCIEEGITYNHTTIDSYNICFMCKCKFNLNRRNILYRAFDHNVCKNCYCIEINKIR